MREGSKSGAPAAWELMQQRTFTKWVQTRLNLGGKREIRVGDLLEDLRSGVVLCQLMEVLRGENNSGMTRDITRDIPYIIHITRAITRDIPYQ